MIFFTYKRALQLDFALRSVFLNFKNLKLPVHVIYHWSKSHEDSYNKLKKEWSTEKVVFHQRNKLDKKQMLLKLLLRPLNLFWYFKSSWLRQSFDNFKFLLEDVINKCNSDFISFSTDDQFMFKKTLIPESALEIIRNNPRKYSYRYITSINFEGEHAISDNLKIKIHNYDNNPSFFEWDNKNNTDSILWKYRFHVDGTIYDKKTILRLLKPMIYHMPTTMEGFGLWEARLRNYFRIGLSSLERTSVGVQANNIQTVSKTPTAFFNPEILREIYEKDFILDINIDTICSVNYIFIPKELTFIHKKTKKNVNYRDFINNS